MILTDELLDNIFGKSVNQTWWVAPGYFVRKSTQSEGYSLRLFAHYTTVSGLIEALVREVANDATIACRQEFQGKIWNILGVNDIVDKIVDEVANRFDDNQS